MLNTKLKRFVARRNRIDGQVRGLRQMVDDNRYCLDEIQQAAAISAAIRAKLSC